MNPKEFGLRVKRLRKMTVDAQGRTMTQAELAKRIGSSQSYISEIESGQVVVSIATVYRLAKALGVELGDLLNGGDQLG